MRPIARNEAAEAPYPSGAVGVKDTRLRRAASLLQQGEVGVLSLDIFDTLVWRTVPEPVDAFGLLGHRFAALGKLPSHMPVPVFARLRQEAEVKARQRLAPGAAAPEISLVEIYEQVPSHVLDGDPIELARLEVEFEKSITLPDLDVVELAEWAHGEGVPIVLVSDTYYGESELRYILDRDPFLDLDVKRIFTSSEHGVGKASGLYRIVLDALGVPPGRVLHVGDHLEADVRAAQREGMRTAHFETLPEPLDDVLHREGLSAAGRATRGRPALDPEEGDAGLTALRSKVLSRTEGSQLAEAAVDYWRFGAVVLGPVFTAFAEWVHQRAQAEGVSVVYCMMREGEFLGRLVNGARRYLDSPVLARTVWVSRHVCSRAAIFQCSEEELSGFLRRRRSPTVREVCESLGVGLADLPELHSEADGRLDDADLRRRFIHHLTRRDDLRATVVAGAAELRNRLVTHFTNSVESSDEKVLVVDLGWGGSIQTYLQKVLAGSGLGVHLRGLYLLTNSSAVERILEGLDAEGFLAQGGFPETPARWIGRSPEILEQVCMTDVGSLAGFTEDGEPVTDPASQSPVQMLQRVAVQKGILAFQEEWARYASLRPRGGRALWEAARPLLLNAVARFVASPTAREAMMFGDWLHDENYGSEAAESVLMADLAHSLRYMTPEQFLALPMTRVYWPSGLAALHNPALAAAATALEEGLVPPEAFRPAEPAHAVVSIDSGRGFGAGMSVSHTVRRSGPCFLRQEITTPGILAVQVQPCEGPALVRIDSISLAFQLRARPDPVRVRFEWPEEFRGLRYEDCVRLADNLLLGTQSPPRVVFPCPPEWGLDARGMELEMTYEVLPLAPFRDPDRRRPSRAEIASTLVRRMRRKAMSLWRSSGALAAEGLDVPPG